MANELQWSLLFSYENGGISESKSFLNQLFDCAGEGINHGYQNFTNASEDTIDKGGVVTAGYYLLRNISTDKSTGIFISFDSVSSLYLPPPTDSKHGGVAFFYAVGGSNPPKGVANAAAVTANLEYWVFPA